MHERPWTAQKLQGYSVEFPTDENLFSGQPEPSFEQSESGLARWGALLGECSCSDDWQKQEASQPFDFRPTEFIKNAMRHPPREKRFATASGFSDWIISLYNHRPIDPLVKEFGLKIERHIFDERSTLISRGDFANPASKEWRLLHNGLHLQDSQKKFAYSIDSLCVGGIPIRGSPDLVYVNDALQKLIIVEIKFSHAPIPSNLWPNIWGQLWVYSKIPEVQAYKQISVVGEVWTTGDKMTSQTRRMEPSKVFLRRSVRRDPRIKAYDRFFQSLFDIYSKQ